MGIKVLGDFRFISFSFWGNVFGGLRYFGKDLFLLGVRFGGCEKIAFKGFAVALLVTSGPAWRICNTRETQLINLLRDCQS